MTTPVKPKQLLLLLGDIAILYGSLFLMLSIRYKDLESHVAKSHVWPFTIIFFFWILIFFIAGSYELKSLKNNREFAKKFLVSLGVNFLIASMFFYFAPAFKITPKTNLFLVLAITGLAMYVWRTTYNRIINLGASAERVLMLGSGPVVQEIIQAIKENPQFGYDIAIWEKEGVSHMSAHDFLKTIEEQNIGTVVVPAKFKKNKAEAQIIYQGLMAGVEIIDLADFYGAIFGKLPLPELEEIWFFEHIARRHTLYDTIKRPVEILLSITLWILTLPLFFLIAFLIKTTSPGSAFFSQTRIGRKGRRFVLWKFRTMRSDAEKDGPKWAKPNDDRVTPIGKILRRTHLDELPQLINILKGDLSFVGPRPERPEFVSKLASEIPFYELRHLVTPGLTGLAQISYRYGASVNDAYEKLQYDIFYLNRRGVWLDLVVLVKTAKLFFVNA
jgi:exopolysaccharide biosynthesis polyprenyl glycosylphosphotransferase